MTLYLLTIIAVGSTAWALWLFTQLARARAQGQFIELEQTRLRELEPLYHRAKAEVDQKEAEIGLLKQQLARLDEQFKILPEQTKAQFVELAHQILDQKKASLNQETGLKIEQTLNPILGPLRERLALFETEMKSQFAREMETRGVLKNELDRLLKLNTQMTQDAQALTMALKGDSKVQGDWGEQILEGILQSSGLREGQEYTRQDSREGQEGERLRPDFVIYLPDSKEQKQRHIIIDSKVTLTAYEEYTRALTVEERDTALVRHIKSVRSHAEGLSKKDYFRLKGLETPDFVFMFIPIEPAYLLAMQKDPSLSAWAWDRGVAIVTATTLFTSLKTVSSLWRLENQSRNAQRIADEGTKLYDKFVGFYEDLTALGRSMDQSSRMYSDAMNKLKDGRGSIYRKIEELKDLGANPKKLLPKESPEA